MMRNPTKLRTILLKDSYTLARRGGTGEAMPKATAAIRRSETRACGCHGLGVGDHRSSIIPEVGKLTRRKRRRGECSSAIPASIIVSDRTKRVYDTALDQTLQVRA